MTNQSRPVGPAAGWGAVPAPARPGVVRLLCAVGGTLARVRGYRRLVIEVLAVALLAGGVMVVAAATEADTATAARARWDTYGLRDYRFVWSTYAMVGPTRTMVEVRDRRVVASTALERDAAGRDGAPRTVEDVFARVADRQSKADHVEVDYHPELGYPTDTDVDMIWNAIDDEHGFTITDLKPLEPLEPR